MIVEPPMVNSSWFSRGASVTALSSTNVPLVEFRSSTKTLSPLTSIAACWREISGSSRAKSTSSRPITTRGLSMAYIFPASGPAMTASESFWSSGSFGARGARGCSAGTERALAESPFWRRIIVSPGAIGGRTGGPAS